MARTGGHPRARFSWLGAAMALVVGALLVPAGQRVFSQADPKAPPPDAKADPADQKAGARKKEEKPVQVVNVDLLKYSKPIYTMTGNVHLRQGEADLYCDQAEYNEDTDTARATGHLKITGRDATVTGDLLIADFGKKVADITGTVRLEAQRKKKPPEPSVPADAKAGAPAAAEAPKAGDEKQGEKAGRFDEYREKLTVVTCEHIQYWYDEERAVATGSVVAVQEDKTVYADEAVYIRNDQEETLTLTANPVKLVMKNGDNSTTPKVTINLQTEEMTTGPLTGIFTRHKKGEENPEAQPEAPTTPAPETKPQTPAPTPPAKP